MQHQVDALQGRAGMIALLRAFRDAGRKFNLSAMVAVPTNEQEGGGYRLLLSIGETTAAMTIREARWFADGLIHRSDGMGELSADLELFGRMVAEILAESPGAYGVH